MFVATTKLQHRINNESAITTEGLACESTQKLDIFSFGLNGHHLKKIKSLRYMYDLQEFMEWSVFRTRVQITAIHWHVNS